MASFGRLPHGLHNKQSAKVDFTTAGSKTFAVTIPNPKVDLQQAEAVAAMDSIITSDLFLTSSGALTGIRDIRVVDTTTNYLFDPQT